MTATVVAIEGIDGAGKSHLTALLADRLSRRGLRVAVLDKYDLPLLDDFAGRRTIELRSIIWPAEPEPDNDPLGTHFYLHLLSAWFAGLARLAPDLFADADVLLTDGSFFRVVAKAHVRAQLDMAWLSTLFESALQPDHVVLLDIDPVDAWRRRSSFKASEVGRWDGDGDGDGEARGFCAYQGRIRRMLLAFAEDERWSVVRQDAGTTPEEAAAAAERELVERLAGLEKGEAIDDRP